MAIIIINPNSTTSMTEAMAAQARRPAPGLTFEAWTSHDGPASIQGPKDGAAATAPLLKRVKEAAAQNPDGIIIGCFDDTALEEAAQIVHCPVIGIGQAAYHFAALRNWKFSVVTTLSVSVPVLEANIDRYGLMPFCAKVRASDIPVLALEADPARTSQIIAAEARAAEVDDQVQCVILGCAGMVGVHDTVQSAVGLNVIDPVTCAARAFHWLC